jgi:hypothetical protein
VLVTGLAAGAAGVTCETVDDAGVVRTAGLTALVTVLVAPVAAPAAALAAVLAVPLAAPVAVLAAPVTALVTAGRTGPGGPESGRTVAAAAGVADSRPMPTRMHRPPKAAPTVYKSTFRADRHQPFMRVTLITQNTDVHTPETISRRFFVGRRIIQHGCRASYIPGFSHDSP